MIAVREVNSLSPTSTAGAAWEALVRTTPESCFMQSLHWAALKRRTGLRALHLLVEEDGLPVGGAIIHIAAGPAGADLFVAPGGPVLPWHRPHIARAALGLLRNTAERLAASYGAIGLRIEPLLPADGSSHGLLRDWGRAPVDLLPSETLYLDLRPAADALLAQMTPKGRYNIGLARRHGVTTRVSHEIGDIPVLYELLRAASERDGFFLEPQAYFLALFEELAAPGLAELIFAEHGGLPLAGMLLVTYGDRATYLYGGSAGVGREHMAGYALQWAAIERARLHGCTDYDFYGYEPHGDSEHAYAGFSRFKRSFGGVAHRFIGAHDFYWSERLADIIVRAINELSGTQIKEDVV